jgi:hypothetical protein
VRGVLMTTPSYGTQFPGLCRSDQLSLNYATLDDRPSEDVPVRPYGLESSSVYRVVGTLRSRDPARSRLGTTWQAACANLSDDHWFSASDDATAYSGVLTLRIAADALKADKPPPINCAKASLTQGQDCKQAMLDAMTVAYLSSVAPCEPKEGRCYTYELGDWSLTIFVTDDSDENNTPKIEKIDLEGPMIVVT